MKKIRSKVQTPTFKELVAAEPRLQDLLEEARAVKVEGRNIFCANYIWYRDPNLRRRLIQLVGWVRSDSPLLSTEAAYSVAYRTVYSALPNCRGCSCP